MDTTTLLSTVAGIVLIFGYAYFKERRAPVENQERRPEFDRFHAKPSSEKMISLYLASQFLEPRIKRVYVKHVLQNGHPYKELSNDTVK
ncbi:MAG: hypothetical protein PHQ90_04455 [Sulfuricurvum sp.]|uniref:hypothetical protein n=1 Tax=Sulfuricurvum sp. TaxID=2025608 RepID=UPI00260A778F|nr:hypothetical protein [Sulfuricurvum sp.]MDD2368531.1 hypothetical protein [Sulfuricurvum sp.]MDD5119459.1 hypothetical protein [Sulfuricurvum sp.]